MASTLEILLRAKYISQGAGTLEAELRNIKKALTDIGKTDATVNIDKFVPQPGALNRVKEELAGVTERIKALRQAQLAAFGEGGEGGRLAGAALEKDIGALERYRRTLDRVIDSAKQQDIQIRPEEFIISEASVQAVRQRVSQMESEIRRLREAATTAFAKNTERGDFAGQEFLAQAGNIEKMKRSMEKTLPVIEKTGFSIENLLTNKLTRLGFGIFALQSSFRTFTQLAQGLFDTLLEGASSLDRSRSFEILLAGEGIEPSRMANRLREASQGLLTLDEAMAKTIQLTKAGFPEIAKNSDALLQIATNAAIVSGDISQAGVVYDKLIRGIIRGSPRLIDDADIILKLGDANEAYAASLGKTVEELTAAEKVQATYNAVLQEGERINKLAEGFDSTAAKVAKMKTEWREFVEVLKEGLAIIVVSDEEAAGSMDQLTMATRSFLDLDVNNRMILIQQLVTSTRGWGVLLTGAFLFIAEGIGSIVDKIRYFAQVVPLTFEYGSKAANLFALSIEYINATMQGLSRRTPVIAEKIREVTKEMQALGMAANLILNTPLNQAGSFVSDFAKKFDDMLEAAGFILGEQRAPMPKIDASGNEIVAGASRTNEELDKILRERARMSEDIEYERVNKIKDINRDHADKMRDIARKLADALSDIDRDLAQKLADLAQDRADKLADIAQDLADKIADIDEDLADKLTDIQQDANEKRQDAQDEYNQGILDAEEEYQKKLRDIQRKYEASRLSALIDRDARALFEAEKQREQDLQDAVETAEEKRKEELEKLLEKIEDINRAEEQQRQDAIRNAEQRRRDAQQAADRARRDALQNYERARRDAQQDADRRRREARENAAQERREALEDQARAREDLRQWYQDKLRDLQRYHQDELQQYSNQYTAINDLTGQFMSGQIDAWNSFQEVLRGNREWIGVGSPTDPTTGEDFPDWRNPANVYSGGRCNRGSSQITIGADGRQYICVRNQWQLFTGVGGQSVGAQTAGIAGGLSGGLTTGGGRAGTQRIILEVRGDEAMTLIKSGAYEAIMEVME